MTFDNKAWEFYWFYSVFSLHDLKRFSLFVSSTKKEGKALVGILHTEIIETEDLVNNENQSKQDKKELEKYLAEVKSILAKLEQ